MLRVVLDTNVPISARRSVAGASNRIVRAGMEGSVRLLASVPLFMEYEAVLARPRNLMGSGLTLDTLNAFLDLFASKVEEVEIHYVWRPQLSDVADEMILEAAINGRADYIVTFNERHFAPAARFGIRVERPATMVRELK